MHTKIGKFMNAVIHVNNNDSAVYNDGCLLMIPNKDIFIISYLDSNHHDPIRYVATLL